MGKVIEIGIANIQGNQIQNVNKVEALKGKGLLNDRKFSENKGYLFDIDLLFGIDLCFKCTWSPLSESPLLRAPLVRSPFSSVVQQIDPSMDPDTSASVQ